MDNHPFFDQTHNSENDIERINALPNLDYKIICGNSLISRYELDSPIDKVFSEFNH